MRWLYLQVPEADTVLWTWRKPVSHQMIGSLYREGVLGGHGWEGRPLWLMRIQTEKWEEKVEVQSVGGVPGPQNILF